MYSAVVLCYILSEMVNV